MSEDSLRLTVRRMTWEAEGVLSVELTHPDGKPLPAWTPGAHLDVHAGGQVRQYSLCGDPHTPDVYRIGVLNEPASRGGSRFVHTQLRPGQQITVSEPRNHFALEDVDSLRLRRRRHRHHPAAGHGPRGGPPGSRMAHGVRRQEPGLHGVHRRTRRARRRRHRSSRRTNTATSTSDAALDRAARGHPGVLPAAPSRCSPAVEAALPGGPAAPGAVRRADGGTHRRRRGVRGRVPHLRADAHRRRRHLRPGGRRGRRAHREQLVPRRDLRHPARPVCSKARPTTATSCSARPNGPRTPR